MNLQRVKSISWLLAALMLWVYGGGRVNAENYTNYANRAVTVASPESRFDALLAELRDLVVRERDKTKSAPEKPFKDVTRLVELKQGLSSENERIQDYFSQLGSFIKQKKLPDEILNRHGEFVREYDAKYEALMENVKGIESAHSQSSGFWAKLTGKARKVDWDALVGKTADFLEANTPRPRESHFDPKNLPHRSLKADKPIQPKLTREEWLKAFAKDSSATQSSSAKAQGSITLAATAPPAPADLAETIEVKFTPEIRQLADSLGRNPVKIFNWVRNNIEFVPTWGSIQGAQLCMETRAGNAFDTASLLIALLRYSGIPARYQMGTIEVPVEKFKNWAGGFTNAEAAASLFASAGVPSVVRRINQSGQVASIKLEHVWVKAFADYAPSGGVVHRQGDTWVEMDASFKQNSFTQGVDLESVIPSNLQTVINQLSSNATVDPVTGSVTNIDSAAFRSAIQQIVDQRVNYLRTNLPNATVREAFGWRAALAQALALLPTAAPYRVLVRADELSQIPDSFRHKVTFALGNNPQMPESAGLFSYTTSLPELAGKNVLLLYAPASQADAQLIIQLRPLLPSSIKLVPQLYLGGQQVAAGGALQAGSPVISQITFSSPTISMPVISNLMAAGEVTAIGLDFQGLPETQLQKLAQTTQNVATQLQQGAWQDLSNRDFAEVLLSNNIARWFAMVDLNNKLTSQSAGVVTIRYPSAGLFFLKQGVNSLFGSMVSATPDGLRMDIDRDIVVSVAKDGDPNKVANVSFIQGALGSALEADSPVRMLSTTDNPVTGVATVQALRRANDQGIPIYNITASNASSIIPRLAISADDLAEIQDAVNAGLEVTVSRTPVNFDGRNVLGIVIRDPRSGSASFLISGGINGAEILLRAVLVEFAVALLFATAGFLLTLLPVLAPIFAALAPFLLVVMLAMILAAAITLLLVGLGFFDLHLLTLSCCELIFNALAILASAVGVIASFGTAAILIGSLGSVLIGLIGSEVCSRFPTEPCVRD